MSGGDPVVFGRVMVGMLAGILVLFWGLLITGAVVEYRDLKRRTDATPTAGEES